ncbi:MAG: divalent-cation tolerance protein CutA [Candidatus Bathyarchaeia archaeon]
MHLVVLVTTSSVKEAEQIAQELLKKRLAACINTIPTVQSRFWWKGRIERCDEALMIIKSRSELFDELAESVRAIHSYQVPEIIGVPVQQGLTEYLDWIDKATHKSS